MEEFTREEGATVSKSKKGIDSFGIRKPRSALRQKALKERFIGWFPV